MKNQKGITLIALVVTIIVLLILAGISIAMLTGDNGIITRTNQSKMSQIEGQVKEEVKLAVQSAKIYAMQTSIETTGGGWFAAQDDTKNTANKGELTQVVDVMKEDLTGTGTGSSLNGYEVVAGNPGTAGAGGASATTTITVNYSTPSYKEATNYTSAKIVATVNVTGNNFTLGDNWIKHYRSADEASGVAY